MPDDIEETPVLDTIAAMTAASVERCDLPPDALLLVRIAAIVSNTGLFSVVRHVGSLSAPG